MTSPLSPAQMAQVLKEVRDCLVPHRSDLSLQFRTDIMLQRGHFEMRIKELEASAQAPRARKAKCAKRSDIECDDLVKCAQAGKCLCWPEGARPQAESGAEHETLFTPVLSCAHEGYPIHLKQVTCPTCRVMRDVVKINLEVRGSQGRGGSGRTDEAMAGEVVPLGREAQADITASRTDAKPGWEASGPVPEPQSSAAGETLRPCPFCGGEAHIERYGDSRKSTIYQCDHCGCRLETGEEWGHGREWNRRLSPSSPHTPAEELVKRHD